MEMERVSYKSAKLLKELGYAEKTKAYYYLEEEFVEVSMALNFNSNHMILNVCSAPRIKEVRFWLEEQFNLSPHRIKRLLCIEEGFKNFCEEVLNKKELV